MWHCTQSQDRCTQNHSGRCLVSASQGLCHFESGDNLLVFRAISICLSGSMFLSHRVHMWGAQSYFLGTRWGLFIKSSPAVGADFMLTPFLHPANIVPIIDKDRVKLRPKNLRYHRFSIPGTPRNFPTPISIFMLLNLNLRLTTVGHSFSY